MKMCPTVLWHVCLACISDTNDNDNHRQANACLGLEAITFYFLQ